MKNKSSVLLKVDYEHKELFALEGIERYNAIKNLSVFDLSAMCSFYKHCPRCPIFLNGNGNRSYCADLASDTLVEDAIANGGYFISLEDVKDEKMFEKDL